MGGEKTLDSGCRTVLPAKLSRPLQNPAPAIPQTKIEHSKDDLGSFPAAFYGYSYNFCASGQRSDVPCTGTPTARPPTTASRLLGC